LKAAEECSAWRRSGRPRFVGVDDAAAPNDYLGPVADIQLGTLRAIRVFVGNHQRPWIFRLRNHRHPAEKARGIPFHGIF
jgi:hypothetical protein